MSRVRPPRRLVLVLVMVATLGGCAGGTSPAPAREAPSPRSSTTSTLRPVATPTFAPTPAASIDPAGPIRIALSGSAPDALVLDDGTAWVLTGEGGTLIEVDLAGSREVRAIPVGFGATHLVLTVRRRAAVARFDDSVNGTFLPVVDLGTGAVEGVTTGALGGLALGDGAIIWALEKAGRLHKVDTTTRRVVRSVRVAIGTNVHTEVQWGAASAWVGSDGTPVLRVDGEDLSIDATIPVDTGLPFLVRDGLVWGAGPEQLWAIDPAANTLARRVPLHNLTEILALDVAGDEAWLAVRHPGQVGAVLRMNLREGTVLAEYAVSLPSAVRIAPDRVWVASYLTNELLGFAR